MALCINDSDIIAESILPAFQQCTANRYSWRLRFAVAEHAYKLAPLLSKQTVDETLLSYYELLMRDHEAEVRSESVGNISKFAKYCSESLLIEKVIPIIQD